ncbi:MAG: hypothetical protein V3V24_09880 [Nitrospinaceae bacterium]
MPDPSEQILVYSFTSRRSLMKRVQKLANVKHDGNRSKMIVELLELGLREGLKNG